jgi:hypothetical protein
MMTGIITIITTITITETSARSRCCCPVCWELVLLAGDHHLMNPLPLPLPGIAKTGNVIEVSIQIAMKGVIVRREITRESAWRGTVESGREAPRDPCIDTRIYS